MKINLKFLIWGAVLLLGLIAFMYFSGGSSSSAEMVLHRGNVGEPGTLDPHKSSGTWESRILNDLFVGLMANNAKAEVVPGIASEYQVSEDGLTYTFKLRKDALWSDGQPVTAHDFVFSFRRILNPEMAAKYANLLYPIKNAEEFNTGKLKNPEELGVSAIDDRTLQVILKASTPYFIAQLKHHTAFPVPKHVVEKHGKNWVKPGRMVNNGAYVLKEWIPNTHVLAVKNPKFFDAKTVKIDRVYYYPTEDSSAALKRFRAGELHLNSEFPPDQIDWLQENLPDEYRVGPYLGIYYYAINHRLKQFQDRRVREALSLAVNREVITDKLLKTGQIPAYSFVPKDMAGYEVRELGFKQTGQVERIARAKKLMEEAGYSEANPLKLQISYNTLESHKKVAVAIGKMWEDIYVKTSLFNTEVAVHYDNLDNGNFEIGRAGWIADYPDAQNFLMLLEYPNVLNYGAYQNDSYNQLMRKASFELNLQKRAGLMGEAEIIALEESALIPIYYYVYKALVSKKLKGWVGNNEFIHLSQFMWIEE